MERLEEKQLTIQREGKERYGRTLAYIYADGQNINLELVWNGLAWWYEYYYPDNTEWKEAKELARQNQCGLWIDNNPINPYDWRKGFLNYQG